MNIAEIKNFDASNGNGIRTSVFVSGCSIHCKGCHNQEAWDFNFGIPFTEQIKHNIIMSCCDSYIKGLSILGGEPLDEKNRTEVLSLIRDFRIKFGNTKDIWLWTGYSLDFLKKEKSAEISEILKLVDVVVDGPFKEELKDVTLKFRGSSNQRILEKREKS